jgi:hypothetical protein
MSSASTIAAGASLEFSAFFIHTWMSPEPSDIEFRRETPDLIPPYTPNQPRITMVSRVRAPASRAHSPRPP